MNMHLQEINGVEALKDHDCCCGPEEINFDNVVRALTSDLFDSDSGLTFHNALDLSHDRLLTESNSDLLDMGTKDRLIALANQRDYDFEAYQQYFENLGFHGETKTGTEYSQPVTHKNKKPLAPTEEPAPLKKKATINLDRLEERLPSIDSSYYYPDDEDDDNKDNVPTVKTVNTKKTEEPEDDVTVQHVNNTGSVDPSKYVLSDNPIVVRETIVVKAGETFDGKNQTYTAGSELGDGGQAEGQKPIFILEDGATLINVVFGSNGADGVHTYGDATVNNVHWSDVGEDALTMKASGTVRVTNSSAENASDKIFQLNAPGTFIIDNFYAKDFGTFLRTNGGQQGNWDIRLTNIRAENGKISLVRSDSTSIKVTASGINATNVKQLYRLPESATLNAK
ncbi:pectate lyase [Limnobacter sp.]|uniref:pectate lyase n=1 Tax=Limnobacter sp. TaxID=2003368 RepID=UPI002FDF74F1